MISKGIDTLEFGLDIENYLESFKSFINTFEDLKLNTQEKGKESEIEINNLSLKVHRNGIPFYSYKLSCEDFSLYFMGKEMKDNPPVKVRFNSSFLWSYGFKGSINNFMNWFQCFNSIVTGTRLSRVDICVDTDEVSFVESDIKGIITRARGRTKHYANDEFFNGRIFTGFTVGRGNPILARIYNKSIEIKTKSNKFWFYDIWNENGWNKDKDVWRVEFQIRREALKELQINSVEDLFEKESSLWSYFTENWLLIKQPSSQNVTRWKVKLKWLIIQKAIYNQKESNLVREKVLIGNTQKLLDQAVGVLLSIAALNNHQNLIDTTNVAISWADFKLKQKHTSFSEEKELRRKRFLTLQE